MSFSDLVREAKTRFVEHGFHDVLEIHLSKSDALRVQREPDVAVQVIDAALDDEHEAPKRGGMRLFAVVSGVRVYVKEN